MAESDLLLENETLKAQIAVLENDVRSRDAEVIKLKAQKRQRKLDKDAVSPFDRPYDGR